MIRMPIIYTPMYFNQISKAKLLYTGNIIHA